jgi:hypothetical protein
MSDDNVRIGIQADSAPATQSVEQFTASLRKAGVQAEKVKQALNGVSADEFKTSSHQIEQNLKTLRERQGANSFLNRGGYNSMEKLTRDADRLVPGDVTASHRRYRSTVSQVLTGTRMEPLGEEIPTGRGGGGATVVGGGRGGMRRGASRGFGMMRRFGGLALGLAGVGGAIALAHQAVRGAQEEATGLDSLMRSLKDTSGSFDEFRKQVERSGRGLALTYQESVQLAHQFAHVSSFGNQKQVIEGARVGEGFARGFGLAPAQGVAGIAQGARLGIGRYTPRQLSRIFADAIAASGLHSRAGEVMQHAAQFMASSERMMVRSPNIRAYSNLFASLNKAATEQGMPGLRGPGAASLIQSMDAAFRRGGGAGIAGQNFIWQALNQHGPRLDPYQVQLQQQGGLFATREDIFGADSLLGKGAGANKTNYENVMEEMNRRFGKDNTARKDVAFGNLFGISGLQSRALLSLKNVDAGKSTLNLMHNAGINLKNVKATGITEIAKIANMSGWDALEKERSKYLGPGSQIGEQDKEVLQGVAYGDKEGLKKALARVAAHSGMYQTTGYRTLSSMTDLKNAVTKEGDALLKPLIDIRNVVAGIPDALKNFGDDVGEAGTVSSNLTIGQRAKMMFDMAIGDRAGAMKIYAQGIRKAYGSSVHPDAGPGAGARKRAQAWREQHPNALKVPESVVWPKMNPTTSVPTSTLPGVKNGALGSGTLHITISHLDKNGDEIATDHQTTRVEFSPSEQ